MKAAAATSPRESKFYKALSEKSLDTSSLDPQIVEALRDFYVRFKSAVFAERIWNRVLTVNEREKLGGDRQACYRTLGTVGMWMKLRGVSLPRAIVDLARQTGLSEADYRWLLHGIGEDSASTSKTACPVWRTPSGELLCGVHVVRRVRIMGHTSNIQRILDAFQAAGWPERIANPLTLGPQQLHEAIRSLNKGLERIRFHALEGGRAITWSGLRKNRSGRRAVARRT